MSICITTAFKNIGRGDWESFTVSSDNYFDGFLKLVDGCPYPIFVYLEEDGRKFLEKKRPGGLRDGVTVLPMESVVDAPIYTRTEQDWKVMKSPEYKEVISDLRGDMPERSRKMYNTITNSKAAFVKHTKQIAPDCEYYIWQDFGTVNLNDGGIGIPTRILRDKLSDKIMMQSLGENWENTYQSPRKMTARPGSGIAGGSISIPSKDVEWLAEKVLETIDLYHSQGVTNDDQAIFLTIHYANPGRFDFSVISDSWCRFWAVMNGVWPAYKPNVGNSFSDLTVL